MERMERIHGSLIDGEDVVLDGLDGFLACHDHKGGRRRLYGYFEMPSDRLAALNHDRRYRLLLSDGRMGDVYTEVVPSNVPGNSIAEFHVSGTLKK